MLINMFPTRLAQLLHTMEIRKIWIWSMYFEQINLIINPLLFGIISLIKKRKIKIKSPSLNILLRK